MLTNFHTHTTFCDGKSTPEEIVLYAIEHGFDAIGFSGHGFTPYDDTYCMQNTRGYIAEIKRLKEKYCGKLPIYLGTEEDAFYLVNRGDYEYIIGSVHYFRNGEKYYSIDHSIESFSNCLELFRGDPIALAETYYSSLCEYALKRKPDIVAHYDLITKFEETYEKRLFDSEKYFEVATKYMKELIKADMLFEVNMGAMTRGVRTSPYPHERLLYVLKENDGKIILSSDAHDAKMLDFHFEETKKMLRDIGFKYIYSMPIGGLKKELL